MLLYCEVLPTSPEISGRRKQEEVGKGQKEWGRSVVREDECPQIQESIQQKMEHNKGHGDIMGKSCESHKD